MPPFQTVLDEHSAAVMGILRGAVGREGAEDCFQETFLAALRAYPKLDDARNLRGWLLKIAQRKAIDAHRARGRRAVPAESLPERVAAPADEPSVNGDPALWSALRELPPKQRTAVFCRSVLGMRYPELAELLESSEDAARRNVHEGLKRLKEEWTP